MIPVSKDSITFYLAYLVTFWKTSDTFIAAAAATAVIVHVVYSTAEQFFGPLFLVVYSAKQWRVDQEIKMFILILSSYVQFW